VCAVLQADAQIYNKVLSLIEDWADAINLPAYRQEYNNLKVRRGGMPCLTHALRGPAAASMTSHALSASVPGAHDADRQASATPDV